MQLFTALTWTWKAADTEWKGQTGVEWEKQSKRPDLRSCLSQYAQHAPEIKSDHLCLF